MEQTKLVGLLKHLNNKEWSRFEDYVQSPFYNKHKEVRQLCSYLYKYIPDDKKKHKLEQQRVWKYLFPDQELDAKRLHLLSSKLLNLLHDYLAIIAHEDNKTTHLIKVLGELRSKKQYKDYAAVLRKVDKTLEEAPEHIENKYWQKYLYHQELDIHFLTQGGRTYDSNLQEKSDSLDLFFMVKKLKTACDMVSRNKVIGSDYAYHFVPELFDYIAQPNNPYAKEPSIQVYIALLKMLLYWEQENYYPVVKELLTKYSAIFSAAELRDIYDFSLNYCIWKQNEDTSSRYYLQEMLEIYRLVVEQKIIFIDGFLPPWEYKTIVTTGISLGESEWVEQFIEAYKIHLPTAVRESAYSYNLAFFLYAEQDYKGALQALYQVTFTNWTYYMGAKMIQLRSYYELNEGEALYALIDTFKVYIRRNRQLVAIHRALYLNFIRVIKKAYQVKEKSDYLTAGQYKKEYAKLKQKQEQFTPVAASNWLKQVIEELAPD